MGKLLNTATDPTQYDKEVGWLEEGKSVQSPSRQYFWHYLQPFLKDLKGKRVLDIGSGTGWFLDVVTQLGAGDAVGVEPSAKNVAIAQELYPNTQTIQSTFENFESSSTFDIITAIMSFVHIQDIETAFQKMATLLKPEGKIVAVVYDFEYARQPRFDYKIEIETLSDDEYVVMVERKNLSIADIVRTSKRFDQAAHTAGLRLIEDIPMLPTETFITARPHYKDYRKTPTHRVLVFSR